MFTQAVHCIYPLILLITWFLQCNVEFWKCTIASDVKVKHISLNFVLSICLSWACLPSRLNIIGQIFCSCSLLFFQKNLEGHSFGFLMAKTWDLPSLFPKRLKLDHPFSSNQWTSFERNCFVHLFRASV